MRTFARRFIPLQVLVVALLLGFVSKAAFAQTLPPASADDQMGMQPYQSYQGGDIDSVGLTNGTLNLDFPFLAYPQRGNLKLSFNLYYNNEPQHYASRCIVDNCEIVWDYTPVVSAFPGGHIHVYSAQSLAVFGTNVAVVVGNGNGKYTNHYANWSIQRPDGSKHTLGNRGSLVQTGSNPEFLFQGTGPWETLDQTAWRVNGSLTAGTGTGEVETPTAVIDPDGIIYNSATAFEEDPNGNQITLNNGIFTDSLGKKIPSGGATSDTSSCPQPPAVLLPVASAALWSVPGPNGNTVNYKFCYATVAVNMAPGTYVDLGLTANWSELQSIVLPNGQTWNFQYNDPGDGSTYNGSPINYGTLTQITLPTGGTISYTYATNPGRLGCQNGGRWVATRNVNANDGAGTHTWTYSYASGATTVTDPLGNYTVHTFSTLGITGGCGLYESVTQFYQNGGAPLKTINTAYNSSLSANARWQVVNVAPTQITTVWPNGKTSQITKTYDAGYSYIDYLGGSTYNGVADVGIYGKVLTASETDYGQGSPGSILRTTTNTYQALNNSTYLTNNLLDLPASIKVTGASQTAYTTFGYDETTPVSSGITTQHDSSPPDGAARGNTTSIHRQLNNGSTTAVGTCPAVSSGGYLVAKITYFDTGMVDVSKDPCTYSTTYGYDPTIYFGAYLTSVTNALNQTTTYTYDSSTGLRASIKDPNLQITSFTYDNMWRLASVTYPDGGSSTITRQETSFPNTATLTKKITSSQNYVTTNVFDGLGRLNQTQLTSDAPSTSYTVTTYDALGRKGTVYNPTRCNPPTTNCGTESTWGYTTYGYDGLSRVTQVTQPDGSLIQSSYTGNSTTVTDEAGKKRTSVTDGLARLTQVFEDPSNFNYETDYTNDALDNLASVVQSSSRNRSFVYDSLKRLTSASNPESGTVAYTYNADGNVLTKKDARNITTTYSYDNLNRLLSKTYSDGTPTVNYTYDGNTPTACSTGVSSYGLAIGRRTAMCDSVSGVESWVYNDIQNVGWQITDKRTTNSVTESTVSQNNLAGSLASLTYPSGRTITYITDTAERPSEAQDVANGINYAVGTCADGTDSDGVCYAPQGAVASVQNGAGLYSTYIYNNRLQPCWMYATTTTANSPPWKTAHCTDSATTGNILDLKYNFNLATSDNGNVMGITNNRVPNRSQSFTYDSLDRITTTITTATHASDPTDCWGESYQYDNHTTGGAWGNLTSIGVASSAYIGCTQESLSVIASGNNQINGNGYDAAGNMTASSGVSYSYNAENQLTSTAGITFTYDGDGNRVEKSNGTLYWYGGGSDPIAESNLTGGNMDEYIFFGGKRVAHRKSTGEIDYYAADHLGTSRIVVNSSGTILDDSDFYPFGGERPAITPTSGNTFKFTGKERDSESGLDYFGARYLSSSMGRFTSPDPMLNSGRPDNPQTWNRYSYALNNPLSITDPTGMYNLVNNCAADNKQCNSDFNKSAKNLKNGLADLTSAVNGMKDGDQKTALQGALKAFGTENDGNNVGVQFGKNADGAAGNTQLGVDASGGLKFTVTFDPSMNQGTVNQAINAAHEGQHVEDESDPRFANDATTLSYFSQEYRAYRTSAYAASALGQSSISYGKNGQYPIWNGSWGAVDKNLTRYIPTLDKPGHTDHQETTPHDPWSPK